MLAISAWSNVTAASPWPTDVSPQSFSIYLPPPSVGQAFWPEAVGDLSGARRYIRVLLSMQCAVHCAAHALAPCSAD